MKMQDTEWFAEWFDTPYYHTLYKDRDFSEAEGFIDRLVGTLDLKANARVLDLACGKGRHALTLSTYGFQVLGVDLSANSIEAAKKLETDKLKFAVHDMREPLPDQQFDAVFNLFTSFGYFDSLEDNQRVISAIAKMLKPNGLLIIDFMNVHHVLSNLMTKEVKRVDEITFNIQRKFDGKHIYKTIQFDADGKSHSHTERVQALEISDFRALLSASNFEILSSFGNFGLTNYDEASSDRLIIIAQLNSWN